MRGRGQIGQHRLNHLGVADHACPLDPPRELVLKNYAVAFVDDRGVGEREWDVHHVRVVGEQRSERVDSFKRFLPAP